MAISAAKRKKLPKSKFAQPSKKKYPLDTLKRARNAPARAQQQANAGNISQATADKIKAKAHKAIDRMTGKKKSAKRKKK